MGMWDWVADLAPTLIETGVKAYGSSQTSKSYNDATAAEVAAKRAATERELAAREEANRLLKQQQQAASPGLTALQGVIGRSDQLTPAQIQALDEARRTTLDTLQAGSLRGSARATAATVNNVEGTMRNNMLAQNQNRADNAAGALAGQYFGTGNTIANNTVQSGQTASQGLTSIGGLQAQNSINQGAINGTAIGDISAVIADSVKEAQTKKRDEQFQENQRKSDVTMLKNGDFITWK